MNSLAVVAQMIEDLYYQDFRTEDDFFRKEHFVFCARALFAKLIDNESKESRRIAKQETGFYTIDLSQEWLISENVNFTRSGDFYQAKLSQSPYYFPYDKMGYGVQTVTPCAKCECKEYIRISPDVKWQFAHMPYNSKAYFFVRKDFITVISKCYTSEAEVWYAPSLDGEPEKVIVPLGKQYDIIEAGVMILKKAKENVVIDTTLDQNPNKVIETEIDKASLK